MKHLIVRSSGRPNETAAFNSTGLRGQGVQYKAGNRDEFVVADGTVLDVGCLTRDVTANGQGLAEQVWPHLSYDRLPHKTGAHVAAEHAQRMEVEGLDFLTVNVTAVLANDTPLTYTGGKLDTVAAGQIPLFRLIQQLTPETEGNVRVLVERTALTKP